MRELVEPHHQLIRLQIRIVEIFPIGCRFQCEIVLPGKLREEPQSIQRKENVVCLYIERIENQHLRPCRLRLGAGARRQYPKTQEQREETLHWPAPQKMAFRKSCVKSLF